MKILELITEGRSWTENSWVGGASDEGHADFDPLQKHNGGFGPRPNRTQFAQRPRVTRRMVPVRMPFDAKDAFKDLVGKGNYAWQGETKTWYVNANILTDELRRQLNHLNVEVNEKGV